MNAELDTQCDVIEHVHKPLESILVGCVAHLLDCTLVNDLCSLKRFQNHALHVSTRLVHELVLLMQILLVLL